MQSMPDRNVAAELAALDTKVNTLLPPRYQHCYTSVSPNSMGSAGLQYGPDGKVCWDQIWTTFCDLALAGGPPHRGTLLEPVSEADVNAAPTSYRNVVAEMDRAIRLTTGLPVVDGYAPGWIGVQCQSEEEAAWLQLAVTAENVSARRRLSLLQLPAGPAFRVEKEIKNVVVALAKASHYWDGHLTDDQQSMAGKDVWEAATQAEVTAASASYNETVKEIEKSLREAGLPMSWRRYPGWIGVETGGEEEAVWLLRAILVEQVLARREGKTLFLAVGATPDPDKVARVGRAFCQARDLWRVSSSRRPLGRGSAREW